MFSRARPRLTFSNVVACLALFAALGGTSYAAVKLPKNSVTTTQVKDNSLASRDVKDGSLSADDLKTGVLGELSTSDVDGPEVPTGPSGSANSVESSKAECPEGTIVTGGGWDAGVRDFIGFAGKSGNGYFVVAINNGSLSSHIKAQAVCASAPNAATPNLKAKRADVAAAEARLLAEARRQAR